MTKLEIACRLSFEDWLATFPEEIPEAEYTENHEKWLKKLFNKMRGDRYHRFTTGTVKVLLVAAILSALMLTAFVIPSSREFIIDNLGIYSTYELTEDNNNSVSGEITVGYIPDGFELTLKQNCDKYTCYQYESKNKYSLIIHKFSSSTRIEFDTQDVDTTEIVIDGITYTYCKSLSGNGSVVWNKNDYIYRVDGNLTRDEMLKIAQTVK